MRKGSALRSFNALRFGLGGQRDIALPLNFMGIEQELVGPGLGIIEYGHFSVTDHHKLLFLERVEPGDKNVSFQP